MVAPKFWGQKNRLNRTCEHYMPLLSSCEPLKSISMESTQVLDVSMSSFDASEVTDLKQSLGAFKSKFRCAIPEFTEASPNYCFHEFVIMEPTFKDEDNTTLLYKEVHTCAESAMGSASVEDFDDGLSTCSSLDDVEVLVMPLRFLPDSGYSCGFQRN